MATAFILAAGGALSAWSGYQASLFDSQQAAAYAEALSLRTRSTQSSTMAGQLIGIDASLFVSWAAAQARHDLEFGEFLHRRMRPPFKTAFDQWLALEPFENHDAPATPFQLPGYLEQVTRESLRLSERAGALQARGDADNSTSDRYGRTAVIFALSLFFAGIAGQFRHLPVRAGVLALSAALVLLGVSVMAALPRAVPG